MSPQTTGYDDFFRRDSRATRSESAGGSGMWRRGRGRGAIPVGELDPRPMACGRVAERAATCHDAVDEGSDGCVEVVGEPGAPDHVVGPVVIARSAGGLVGRGMSLWMTAGELARTVGPIVAVAVVGWWGFERAYPVMIVGLVATGYMFLRLKDVSTVGPVRTSGSLIQTWRRLRPVMFPLAWLILARAFISATLINYLPTYMVGMGQSLWFGGVCLAVLELFGTAGTFFGGPLSDRAGRGRILWASMLTAPLFMLVFLNVHGWIVFPVLACLGISFFAGSPVMLALVQDHAKGSRATANGLFMGINFCIAALVLLLVGRLVDVLGFQTAFTLSACMGFVGLPAVFFLPRPVREDNIKK